MRAVLIPVKEMALAKQRMAGLLSQRQREELTRSMLADVAGAVARIEVDVFIVSKDPWTWDFAASRGWATCREDEQESESRSVDRASQELETRGYTSLLRLPADLPLVQPAELEHLFEAASAPRVVVLAPSHDGGTNALLRSPPGVISSQFGEGSLARHLAAAHQAKVPVRVVESPGLRLDLDTPADLRRFLPLGRSTETWKTLRRFGVCLEKGDG